MKLGFAAQLESLSLALLAVAWTTEFAHGQQLAYLAPADTGLYVELNDATDLLVAMTAPDRWSAVAEFAGQPATGSDALEWRERVRETIGTSPEEAIRTLFARGVAFIGAGPFRSQDPVLLCRPAAHVPIPALLHMWNAEAYSEPELASVFSLRNQLGLAIYGDTLMFGSPAMAGGTFRQALESQKLGPASSLAATEEFQRLLKRIPPNPTGIIFIRHRADLLDFSSGSGPPAVALLMLFLPEQLRRADAWMIALHRNGDTLKFTAVGHTTGPAEITVEKPIQIQLPDNTLAAWNGHVNFDDLWPQLHLLPDQHLFRLTLPNNATELANRIFTGGMTVAFSALPAPDQDAPATPVLGVVLEARDAPGALAFIDGAVSLAKIAFDTYAAQRGLVPLPSVRKQGEAPDTIRSLDLSDLFAARVIAQLGTIELCWSASDNHLVIATQRHWLKQILQSLKKPVVKLAEQDNAAKGENADPAANAETPQPEPLNRSTTSIVCRGQELSDLGSAWLEKIEQTDPELMTESWWRRHQPGNVRPRLGITVTTVDEGKGLQVDAVEAGLPADGFLQVGDVIVGCNGERFDTTARREASRRMRDRPYARWIDLTVRRDATIIDVRVPLPFVNPVRMLQQAVALGQIIGDVVYVEELGDAGRPRGILTVAWRHKGEVLPAEDWRAEKDDETVIDAP